MADFGTRFGGQQERLNLFERAGDVSRLNTMAPQKYTPMDNVAVRGGQRMRDIAQKNQLYNLTGDAENRAQLMDLRRQQDIREAARLAMAEKGMKVSRFDRLIGQGYDPNDVRSLIASQEQGGYWDNAGDPNKPTGAIQLRNPREERNAQRYAEERRDKLTARQQDREDKFKLAKMKADAAKTAAGQKLATLDPKKGYDKIAFGAIDTFGLTKESFYDEDGNSTPEGRSFAQLIAGGMPPEQAKKVSGLMTPQEMADRQYILDKEITKDSKWYWPDSDEVDEAQARIKAYEESKGKAGQAIARGKAGQAIAPTPGQAEMLEGGIARPSDPPVKFEKGPASTTPDPRLTLERGPAQIPAAPEQAPATEPLKKKKIKEKKPTAYTAKGDVAKYEGQEVRVGNHNGVNGVWFKDPKTGNNEFISETALKKHYKKQGIDFKLGEQSATTEMRRDSNEDFIANFPGEGASPGEISDYIKQSSGRKLTKFRPSMMTLPGEKKTGQQQGQAGQKMKTEKTAEKTVEIVKKRGEPQSEGDKILDMMEAGGVPVKEHLKELESPDLETRRDAAKNARMMLDNPERYSDDLLSEYNEKIGIFRRDQFQKDGSGRSHVDELASKWLTSIIRGADDRDLGVGGMKNFLRIVKSFGDDIGEGGSSGLSAKQAFKIYKRRMKNLGKGDATIHEFYAELAKLDPDFKRHLGSAIEHFTQRASGERVDKQKGAQEGQLLRSSN